MSNNDLIILDFEAFDTSLAVLTRIMECACANGTESSGTNYISDVIVSSFD